MASSAILSHGEVKSVGVDTHYSPRRSVKVPVHVTPTPRIAAGWLAGGVQDGVSVSVSPLYDWRRADRAYILSYSAVRSLLVRPRVSQSELPCLPVRLGFSRRAARCVLTLAMLQAAGCSCTPIFRLAIDLPTTGGSRSVYCNWYAVGIANTVQWSLANHQSNAGYICGHYEVGPLIMTSTSIRLVLGR
jgi:hypothetical protein